MKVGYARVSTEDQSLDIQRTQLADAGCERIYEEKASGKSKDTREQLKNVVDFVREGDILVVTKLDRMARNTLDMLTIIQDLAKRGAKFNSIAEPWANTDSPAGELIITIMAGVAEFERKRLKERQAEGIARAKANGVYKRERIARVNKRTAKLRALREKNPGISARRLAELGGCSERTVYRLLPDGWREQPDYLAAAIGAKPKVNPALAVPSTEQNCAEMQKPPENKPKRGFFGLRT